MKGDLIHSLDINRGLAKTVCQKRDFPRLPTGSKMFFCQLDCWVPRFGTPDRGRIRNEKHGQL
jgi:hypothetical protein